MLLTVGADGLTLKRTCRFAYGSTMGHGHARSRITRDVGIVLAVASDRVSPVTVPIALA